MEYVNPESRLTCFFERDAHLIGKILSAKCVFPFKGICANAGSCAKQLFGHDMFVSRFYEVFIKVHDTNSKIAGYFIDIIFDILIHIGTIYKPQISNLKSQSMNAYTGMSLFTFLLPHKA